MNEEAELVPVERKLHGEKTIKVCMQRRSEANVDASLTPAMQDAKYEIERAFRIIASHQMGVSDHSLDRVKGVPGQDKAEWEQLQIHKFDNWKKDCPRLEYAITLDVIVFGFTARQTAVMRGTTHPTVMSYLRRGLNIYCVQNGFGEQIS